MSQISNGSFFDAIADKIRPSTVPHDRIVSLDYDQTIDKIIVVLGLSWHHVGFKVNRTQVIVIEMDDFERWCDKCGRLFMDTDMSDDSREIEVPFYEYMKEYVSKSDIQDYIIDQNLTPYVWKL